MNQNLKRVAISLVASAFALSVSAFADGEPGDNKGPNAVQKGTDKLWLKLSGQVNRAVLYAQTDTTASTGNNHTDQEVFHVDNSAASTRITLDAGKSINDDLSLGATLQFQVQANPSDGVNFGLGKEASKESDSEASFKQRLADIYLKSHKWGTASMGRGWMAAALTTSVDLSDTDIVLYSGVGDIAGGLVFGKSVATATGGAAGTKVSQAFSTLEAFARKSRLRYDSPVWRGFQASASLAEFGDWDKEDHSDAALRYAEELNGVKVAAAVGYGRDNDNSNVYDFHTLTGSASALLPNGWNFTVAGAKKSPSNTSGTNHNQTFWYGKVGYIFNPFPFGKTALAVDYGKNDDVDGTVTVTGNVGRKGNESKAWGAAVVQHFASLATEGYLAFRNYDHDPDKTGRASAKAEDIQIVMLGARVKF
ncbi:MAG: hypothetical protein HY559_02030 [Gammaproteobacteria bacterium]|nr:hypothetical protein [Gammaproteobacteria bacterium]